MNAPFDSGQPQTVTDVPIEFDALYPAPQLLPGESLDHYRALQAAIFQDIAPQSAIEWLLAMDIAELSWEMRRGSGAATPAPKHLSSKASRSLTAPHRRGRHRA